MDILMLVVALELVFFFAFFLYVDGRTDNEMVHMLAAPATFQVLVVNRVCLRLGIIEDPDMKRRAEDSDDHLDDLLGR